MEQGPPGPGRVSGYGSTIISPDGKLVFQSTHRPRRSAFGGLATERTRFPWSPPRPFFLKSAQGSRAEEDG
jgi:hypothetical protein